VQGAVYESSRGCLALKYGYKWCLDDSNLVGNVQGVVVCCQPHVRLLLSIRPADTPCITFCKDACRLPPGLLSPPVERFIIIRGRACNGMPKIVWRMLVEAVNSLYHRSYIEMLRYNP